MPRNLWLADAATASPRSAPPRPLNLSRPVAIAVARSSVKRPSAMLAAPVHVASRELQLFLPDNLHGLANTLCPGPARERNIYRDFPGPGIRESRGDGEPAPFCIAYLKADEFQFPAGVVLEPVHTYAVIGN